MTNVKPWECLLCFVSGPLDYRSQSLLRSSHTRPSIHLQTPCPWLTFPRQSQMSPEAVTLRSASGAVFENPSFLRAFCLCVERERDRCCPHVGAMLLRGVRSQKTPFESAFIQVRTVQPLQFSILTWTLEPWMTLRLCWRLLGFSWESSSGWQHHSRHGGPAEPFDTSGLAILPCYLKT